MNTHEYGFNATRIRTKHETITSKIVSPSNPLEMRLHVHRKISAMLGWMNQYSPSLFDDSGDTDVASLLSVMPKVRIEAMERGDLTTYTVVGCGLDGVEFSFTESY